MLFDIVIPVGPKDSEIIKKQIEYTKKNIIGYRNIYVISKDDELVLDGCIIIKENIFPFTMKTLQEYWGDSKRNGWYLQQLLKLYAGFVIPDILDSYLVVDSDTFFLKPITFYEDGKFLYNFGNECCDYYFRHMKRLDDIFEKHFPDKSGICHHMIFEKRFLKDIFDRVEKKHNIAFYHAFLKSVTEDIGGCGASEYEIYFNYIFKHYPNEVKLRYLNWVNTGDFNLNCDRDYISYHWYMR